MSSANENFANFDQLQDDDTATASLDDFNPRAAEPGLAKNTPRRFVNIIYINLFIIIAIIIVIFIIIIIIILLLVTLSHLVVVKK